MFPTKKNNWFKPQPPFPSPYPTPYSFASIDRSKSVSPLQFFFIRASVDSYGPLILSLFVPELFSFGSEHPLYTNTRYNDKIRYNDNLTVTKPSLKR